jgi:hypothetical protein
LFFCDSNKIIDKTITFPDFSKVFRKKHSKLSFFHIRATFTSRRRRWAAKTPCSCRLRPSSYISD